jgi:hypothetical protein
MEKSKLTIPRRSDTTVKLLVENSTDGQGITDWSEIADGVYLASSLTSTLVVSMLLLVC